MIHAFKPNSLAERYILQSIHDGLFRPGSFLPSERELAERIGVTRTTLREVTGRLSREGWLTIRHGKPTRVNDYQRSITLNAMDSLITLDTDSAVSYVEDVFMLRAQVGPVVFEKCMSTAGMKGEEVLDSIGAALVRLSNGGELNKSPLYSKFYNEFEAMGIYIEHQSDESIREKFIAWLDFELFRSLAIASGCNIWVMAFNSLRDVYLRIFQHYYRHEGAFTTLVGLVTKLKAYSLSPGCDYRSLMARYDSEVHKIWCVQQEEFRRSGLDYIKG